MSSIGAGIGTAKNGTIKVGPTLLHLTGESAVLTDNAPAAHRIQFCAQGCRETNKALFAATGLAYCICLW